MVHADLACRNGDSCASFMRATLACLVAFSAPIWDSAASCRRGLGLRSCTRSVLRIVHRRAPRWNAATDVTGSHRRVRDGTEAKRHDERARSEPEMRKHEAQRSWAGRPPATRRDRARRAQPIAALEHRATEAPLGMSRSPRGREKPCAPDIDTRKRAVDVHEAPRCRALREALGVDLRSGPHQPRACRPGTPSRPPCACPQGAARSARVPRNRTKPRRRRVYVGWGRPQPTLSLAARVRRGNACISCPSRRGRVRCARSCATRVRTA